MRVTFLGHAGLFVETRFGTILCDPWFNPAYFESWFPFPRNDGLDVSRLGRPDYLYCSHLHRDHFDPRFLSEHVDKGATILLPDYPLGLLEDSYRDLGFTRFVKTRNGAPLELDGLRIAITALVAPTDGPIGDSSLVVDDGTACVIDQNDSRPVDLERLAALGPFDGHFLQFSGAIWFPFVYQYPGPMVQALARKKRATQMERALRYVTEIGARWVVPSAGPPCFLDEDLFHLNDFDRADDNIFPDQTVFLDLMRERGHLNGRLAVPGSTLVFEEGGCRVTHPLPEAEVAAVFSDKRAYLERYQADRRAGIVAARASWPRGRVDVVESLREWFEPLLEKADITCAGVGGVVVLDLGDEGVAIDFHRRRVEPWEGQEWSYHFRIDRSLVEDCILEHREDWVNSLFLSCRFEARRTGPYNEYIYNFFKCLSMERLQYAEGYYAEQSPIDQFWEAEGYRIQRRCPHLKADLTKFARIEDGVLTCTLHGWQFELETGRCLTSDDRRLYSRPLTEEGAAEAKTPARAPSQEAAGATVRAQCDHCLYEKPGKRSGGDGPGPGKGRAAG
ncbi:MAG: Rieske 2Fe-2S domain-containing protein [Candidatus Dormibacterales bacterium]